MGKACKSLPLAVILGTSACRALTSSQSKPLIRQAKHLDEPPTLKQSKFKASSPKFVKRALQTVLGRNGRLLCKSRGVVLLLFSGLRLSDHNLRRNQHRRDFAVSCLFSIFDNVDVLYKYNPLYLVSVLIMTTLPSATPVLKETPICFLGACAARRRFQSGSMSEYPAGVPDMVVR